MRLTLTATAVQQIRKHAERAYPRECCGLLIGRERDGQRLITRTAAVRNQLSHSSETRYSIASGDLLEAEKQLEGSDELLGIYHSHPDCAARPSPSDLEQAWPWYSYLIGSVIGGRSQELRSWRLLEDRSGFQEETVLVESHPAPSIEPKREDKRCP